MEHVAELVISILELVEAEAASVRQKIYRMGLALILALAAGVLFLGGFGILVWGIYLAFLKVLTPVWAALADALCAFILGGGLLLWAKRMLK